jgi:hopene-associated glycosyltransferase HpnB
MSVLATVALVAWLYLVFAHGWFWRTGTQLRPARHGRLPDVAIVVPARDEADVIGRSIASLLAQDYPGRLRVVLVDDGSSDGTAAIAAARGGAAPRRAGGGGGAVGGGGWGGPAPPHGWAGKLWAVHQGVAATDEALLLLTDADITHDPRHVATLVAQAERHGLDMVSEMVKLNCTSLAERALIPAFVYLFAMLYPFEWVCDPLRATAAAAGGTILIRRRALQRIGGIAAIGGALIDDVTLAQRVKRGGRIWLGHSLLARSIRPYPGFADIWRMVARSAYVQLRRSPLLLVLTTIGLGWLFLLPPSAAILWQSRIALASWVLMAVSFVPSLRRFGLTPLWAPLLPPIAAFYMAATMGAALAHHRGRGVVWKNRAYTENQV